MPSSSTPSGHGRKTTASGRPRADRAAQFMPFDALAGYYELVRKQERVAEPRRELTEEAAERLSRKLSQVRRGDLVRVTYYDWDGYISRVGVVEQVDAPFHMLRLKGQSIPFDDIYDIERRAGAGTD